MLPPCPQQLYSAQCGGRRGKHKGASHRLPVRFVTLGRESSVCPTFPDHSGPLLLPVTEDDNVPAGAPRQPKRALQAGRQAVAAATRRGARTHHAPSL